MLDLLRNVRQWPHVLITIVSLLSVRVVDLCLFFLSLNFLLGLLQDKIRKGLFMVKEKTGFYLAYNTVNLTLKMFASSRFQFNLKS